MCLCLTLTGELNYFDLACKSHGGWATGMESRMWVAKHQTIVWCPVAVTVRHLGRIPRYTASAEHPMGGVITSGYCESSPYSMLQMRPPPSPEDVGPSTNSSSSDGRGTDLFLAEACRSPASHITLHFFESGTLAFCERLIHHLWVSMSDYPGLFSPVKVSADDGNAWPHILRDSLMRVMSGLRPTIQNDSLHLRSGHIPQYTTLMKNWFPFFTRYVSWKVKIWTALPVSGAPRWPNVAKDWIMPR